MQIRGFEYRPSIVETLSAVIIISIFLALGFWQLQRAEEKRQIQDDYAARHSQTPVKLEFPLKDTENWRYRQVEISGRFDNHQQFLLDNQVSQGEVGYSVLTPLHVTGNGPVVLVDRGWVPLGQTRERLPNIDVSEEPVDLVGTAYVPFGKAYALGEIDSGQDAWPRVIQFLDFKLLGQRLDTQLPPLTVRLDQSSEVAYRQDWKIIAFTPQRHLGYAFQWFAMAAALAVIYIVVSVKKRTEA